MPRKNQICMLQTHILNTIIMLNTMHNIEYCAKTTILVIDICRSSNLKMNDPLLH